MRHLSCRRCAVIAASMPESGERSGRFGGEGTMIKRFLWSVFLVLAAVLLGFAQEIPPLPSTKVSSSNAADSYSGTVAAEVDDRVLTFDEVDRAISQQLQDLEERRYQLRRAALEQRINQLLLEKAANSRGLSIPSLMLSRVRAVSESDVEATYRRNKDRSVAQRY